MLKKILLGLAILFVVLLVVIALQPGEYKVTRTGTIHAAPAVVFPHVNELKKWEAWNPWGKLDPAMTLTYAGPEGGPGASYAWAGNSQVGEGRMTIVESRTNELIRFHLEFIKPMPGISPTEFVFKPDGTNTAVTWTMHGTNNFIGKAFCLFMDMDAMIGGSFEKGLASLDAAVQPEADR